MVVKRLNIENCKQGFLLPLLGRSLTVIEDASNASTLYRRLNEHGFDQKLQHNVKRYVLGKKKRKAEVRASELFGAKRH